MAGFKDVFQRIEVKYLLDDMQYTELMKRLENMAAIDSYGKTSILNIYYDTPDYTLIKRSLDKPVYKEKLRLRTYGVASDDTNAFIEIKKKYKGVVYKRRISMPYKEAVDYLSGDGRPQKETQISREIDYFLKYYKGIRPAMAISYDRIAMAGIEDPDLRITFDTNIRWRTDHLSLKEGNRGKDLLLPGQHLMELKIAGAMSVELARILDELNIRKTSFSKYGKGYMEYCERLIRKGEYNNVYNRFDLWNNNDKRKFNRNSVSYSDSVLAGDRRVHRLHVHNKEQLLEELHYYPGSSAGDRADGHHVG